MNNEIAALPKPTKRAFLTWLAIVPATLLLVAYCAAAIALAELNNRWGPFVGQPLSNLVSLIGKPDAENAIMGESYWHKVGLPTATLVAFTSDDFEPHDKIRFMTFILFDTSDTYFFCPIEGSDVSTWYYLIAPLRCSWSLKA